MARINPAYIAEVKNIVRNSPFPNHMSMQLLEMDIDMAEVTIEIGREHLQPFGIVHGGVLATLIDTATFWSAFMRIPEDAGLVNVDIKLNYLSSVKEGVLKAEGRTIRSGKTLSYAEARVIGDDGRLLAHGTSTLMIMPGKGLHIELDKFS